MDNLMANLRSMVVYGRILWIYDDLWMRSWQNHENRPGLNIGFIWVYGFLGFRWIESLTFHCWLCGRYIWRTPLEELHEIVKTFAEKLGASSRVP